MFFFFFFFFSRETKIGVDSFCSQPAAVGWGSAGTPDEGVISGMLILGVFCRA